MSSSSSHSAYCANLLAQAHGALAAGQRLACERLASEAWAGAAVVGDNVLKAQAELALAQVDVLESRFQQAQTRSSRAAVFFDKAGIIEALPLALEVQSYASVSHGLSKDALAAGMAAVRLQELENDPRKLAQGLNYLGVTQTYSSNFSGALDSLEASVWYAAESKLPGAQLHPMLNLALASLMALPQSELPNPSSSEIQEFSALTARLEEVHRQSQTRTVTLHAGVEPVAHVFREFLTCASLSLSNRCDDATGHLITCNMWLEQLPRNSWLRSLSWWAQTLLALRKGQYPRALACCKEMHTAASLGGHVPVRDLAKALQTAIQEQMG